MNVAMHDYVLHINHPKESNQKSSCGRRRLKYECCWEEKKNNDGDKIIIWTNGQKTAFVP